MAKKKYGSKRVADAIRAARGERSLREYAADANVNYMTIYKLEKGESSPTPETIKKLTTGAARPRNNITYDIVMTAAGYHQDSIEDFVEIVNEPTERPRREIKRIVKNRDTHAIYTEMIRFRHYGLGLISQTLSNRADLQLKTINYPMYERSVTRIDMMVSFYNQEIEDWWFEFKHVPDSSYRSYDYSMVGTLGRICLIPSDKKRKVSVVIDNPDMYLHMKEKAGCIAYKGDMSIILIDVNEGMIVEETYLSHYDDCVTRDIFIV